MELRPGLSGSTEIVVGEEHTAPRVGSGRVHVLATPVMINLFEAAALAAIEHLLPEGYQSLGTHLDVRHIAATPVGMKVCASATVTRVDGRITGGIAGLRIDCRCARPLDGGLPWFRAELHPADAGEVDLGPGVGVALRESIRVGFEVERRDVERVADGDA